MDECYETFWHKSNHFTNNDNSADIYQVIKCVFC